tara:strand:+ start:361 stop:939 length:579 start_codon:yes stop_codon:yes gene_type:complete
VSKKVNKLLNGNYSLFPDNAEKFPTDFLEDEDTFFERLGSVVKESYRADGESTTKPVMGIVLAVKKNGKVTPSGPRSRLNIISEIETETCLKMWVHTNFDVGMAVPKNFLNPGDETNLIYEHFVFEAQDETTDKIVPKPGDIVQVLHPWAWGFTNKVGLYLGKVAPGMAPTFERSSNKFKKPNSRNKNVPET